MRKVFLSLSLVSLLSVGAVAQTKRTVTNFDLEKYRQQRIQADADYERKAQNGTVPSKAELEKREQERQQFITEFSQKATAEHNEAENYWQAQAYNLRTQIAAAEAEINYLDARVSEIPTQQVYYSVGSLPYNNCCLGGIGFPRYSANRINNAPIAGGRLDVRASAGGGSPTISVNGSLGQTTVRQNNTVRITGNLNTSRANLGFGGIPYQPGILIAPYTFQTPQNYTREELLDRLRLLEQTRAGLYAQFEVLQDEAQRNGININ